MVRRIRDQMMIREEKITKETRLKARIHDKKRKKRFFPHEMSRDHISGNSFISYTLFLCIFFFLWCTRFSWWTLCSHEDKKKTTRNGITKKNMNPGANCDVMIEMMNIFFWGNLLLLLLLLLNFRLFSLCLSEKTGRKLCSSLTISYRLHLNPTVIMISYSCLIPSCFFIWNTVYMFYLLILCMSFFLI